jgi:hypothetical protein
MPISAQPLQLILNAGDADKLRLENQNAVGGDRTHSPCSVSPIRLNGQLALLARAHVEETLIPTLDDLAFAYDEGEGLAAVVRGVEFGACLVVSMDDEPLGRA